MIVFKINYNNMESNKFKPFERNYLNEFGT